MTLRRFAGLGALLPQISPGIVPAHEATLDSFNTERSLTAVSRVLFMPIPGIASFDGGMVRSMNIPFAMAQCFASAVVYSATFAILKVIDAVMGPRGREEEAASLAMGLQRAR